MLIIELGGHYSGKSYNIISKNCNHFGDEFAKKLCGKGIPGWINRLAFVGNTTFWDLFQYFLIQYLGSFFSCVLPIPADEFGPVPVQPNSPNNGQTSTPFNGKGRRLSE